MPEITMKGYQCARCAWKWVPRKAERPVICPHCKTPYWDKPIERPTTSEARKKAKVG